MTLKVPRESMLNRSLVSLAVAACFSAGIASANPTGPQVVNGAATFQNPNASTLAVTNSPGAIINWQGFSIGAGEVTRFLQQSSASSVLNRVVTGDVSQIYGQLLSNGRVFLINPGGILVGPGAVVDTVGFVASTLNMVDADFIAGKLKFQGDASSGSITNQGWIRTGYGGKVVLVAPHIENSGLIHTPGGELILAAGQKLTVSSLDHEGVQFEVQAPTNSVVNLGKLLADGGAVGVFAGTLKHSGDIRANSLVYDQAGQVVLQATNEIQLTAGSTTTADGKTGGSVTVQASGGLDRVAGTVSAQGSAGRGGDIRILGERVAVVENAMVNASGTSGGGQVLIGGDFQGGNAAVQNSSNTFVGADATLRADATAAGDGGRIVVWSDDKAQFYGSLSAQGGPNGGNGGFAEVSGKQGLVFAGGANLGAPKGKLGSLLLDPIDLFVDIDGGLIPDIIDENTDFPSNAVTVSPGTLADIVGNVTLFAARYMRINSAIDLTQTSGATPTATPGKGLTAQVGTWPDAAAPLAVTDPLNMSVGTVPNQFDIGANITTANGAVSLSAPRIQSFAASTIATAGGAINLGATGAIQASSLSLDAGSATVTVAAGNVVSPATAPSGSLIQLSAVTGGSFTATAPESIQMFGAVTVGGGAVTLNSAAGSISTFSTIDTRAGGTGPAGGAVTITSPSAVTTRSILAGSGNITLSGSNLSNSSSAPLDTTGTVSLTASSGGISSFKINNASGVTANSTSSTGSAFVNLSSDTALNANTVTATTTQCSTNGSCSSASINLSGELGVNIGTVTATAPTNFTILASPSFGATYADERFESINSSVDVFSNAGSIRAQSATSLVTANNVTLRTTPFSASGGGGGIGVAATPVRVDARSNFTFNPNGEFNTQLVGTTGPNTLNMQIGVAPLSTAGTNTYSGTLTKSGQIDLSVTATETTVTAGTFNISGGFDTRISNTPPSIRLYVPNGNLVATSVSVPKGDQAGILSPSARRNCDVFGGTSCPPQPTIEGLPVQLWADKDLTVASYTRGVGTVAKSTDFRAFNGSVTLGTINANIDSLSVFGSTGVTIPSLTHADGMGVSSSTGLISLGNVAVTGSLSASSNSGDLSFANVSATAGASASTSSGSITLTGLTTSGSATASTSSGNISLGTVVSGTGGATISAPLGTVQALTDSAALEVTSGGSISVNAKTIGASGTNPLDLAGASISLTSNGGGAIGLAGAPVSAITQNLTVNASSGSTFNVGTGPTTALKNLTVTASAPAVGAGLARVTSEATNYDFISDGSNFSFNPVVPGTQFTSGGLLGFTSPSGNVTLGNANLGTGGLALTASNGSIATGTLDGAAITLTAGTTAGAAPVSITTGNVGSLVRPGSLTVTAGNGSSFGTTRRAGSVETGTIVADSVSVTTYDGGIKIGPNGTDPIGTSGTPAGTVTLTANDNFNLAGTSGTIQTGNVFGASLNFYNRDNTITTGNLDASSSITLRSDNNVQITTGSLDAPSLTVGPTFCCPYPGLTTGTIGATRPVKTLSIASATTNIGGAITGDAASADSISISASGPLTIGGTVTAGAASNVNLNAYSSGLLTVGDITAGDGSTINLNSSGATAFQFANINAGTTGTVGIRSSNGIEQTGGSGITAATVSLSASNSTTQIAKFGTSPAPVDLHGTTSLTLEAGGDARVNLNGSTLADLTIYKYSAPTGTMVVTGMTGQTVTIGDNTGGSHTLALSSATPLEFTSYFNGGGIELTGGGIATGGGNLYLDASGPINATTGGITTLGGSATLYANGTINTGAINTAVAANGAGGGISVNTSDAAGNIVADGNLNTGTGGGSISLSANFGGAITRSASATITSDAGVNLYTGNGDIGTGATPMLITSPTVSLQAGGATFGSAYASLTGTSSLDLDAYNGFNVSSNTALTTLTLSTQGAGTGAPGTNLDLSATGQTYAFARPATDMFANPLTNAFGVVSAVGPTTANFTVSGGTLYVGGGSITIPNLTLTSSVAGSDIVLQGTSVSSLNLSNTNQTINAARDLLITGNVTLSASGQQRLLPVTNLTAQARDGSITISAVDQAITSTNGTIAFLGGTAADEKVSVTASSAQTISTTQFSGGQDIKLMAGTGDRASVTVSYTGTGAQTVQANRDVVLHGGDGTSTDSVATITTGTGSQLVRAERDITLTGGAGTNGAARIVNTGTSEQQVGESRCGSFCTPFAYQTDNIILQGGTNSEAAIAASGEQRIQANLGLQVLGGSGTAGRARIESTSATAEQRIGCGASGSGESCSTNLDTLTMTAGAGGAFAEIVAAGTQRLRATSNVALTGHADNGGYAKITAAGPLQRIQFGNTVMTAGAGAGSNVEILHTGTGPATEDTQNLSFGSLTLAAGGTAGGNTAVARISTTDVSAKDFSSLYNQRISAGGLTMSGGAGPNTIAEITTAARQNLSFSGTSLMAGGAGADSFARIATTGAQSTQTLGLFGSFTMKGGAGSGAFARINALADQNISFSSLILDNSAATTGSGAYVKIDTAGPQTLSGSNLTLKAGGAGEATLANAGAIIEGHSQDIFGSSITLQGGAGTSGNTSDAVLRNLSGDQTVSGSTFTLQGGHQFSTTGFLNTGTGTAAGTQTISANSITLLSDPVLAPAHSDAYVRIENQPATDQIIFGRLALTNSGAGLVAITSAGDQSITASSGGIVLNTLATGPTEVTAAGAQNVRAQYVDVLTGAGSTGNAMLAATGNQWIRTTSENASPDATRPFDPGPLPDYGLRVAAFGTGTASIESGASQLLEITYPNMMQTTGVAAGLIVGGTQQSGIAPRLEVAGTSRIKAVDQTIFAGTIWIETGLNGASPTQQFSEIKASNNQVITTLNGGIMILGGVGNDTVAQIDPVNQTIVVNGTVNVIGGTGTNALAQIVAGSGGTLGQTILATNGDILLDGGSGVGANALITSGGLQTVGASGEILLTPGVTPLGGPGGSAGISPLGSIPAGCAAPCILTTVASGGSIIAETFATNPVVDQFDELIELTDTTLMAEDTTILTRRAPICR